MLSKIVPEIETIDYNGLPIPELYSKEGIVFGNLLASSAGTIQDHLTRAVECIDHMFGAGYARKHLDLVATIVQTISSECCTALTLRTTERCVVHGVEWLRRLEVMLRTTPIEVITLPNQSTEAVGSKS